MSPITMFLLILCHSQYHDVHGREELLEGGQPGLSSGHLASPWPVSGRLTWPLPGQLEEEARSEVARVTAGSYCDIQAAD